MEIITIVEGKLLDHQQKFKNKDTTQYQDTVAMGLPLQKVKSFHSLKIWTLQNPLMHTQNKKP